MAHPDFNLLIALDVLLETGSVAEAARRLGLSPSAMSRTLTRLREVTGDPLLVRAGRGLVPTPRALDLRGQTAELVQAVAAVLRPAETLDPARLERIFTLRVSDGFVENFGPALIARLARQAPGVRVRFVPKPDRDSSGLRDGTVDLETGVAGPATGPEVRTQALFQDQFVGVVRADHPLLTGVITPARYAAGQHTLVTRRGLDRGVVDEALAALGLTRRITAMVGGFSVALALARSSDLIATVPARQTGSLRDDLVSFALPVAVPGITVALLWHPRQDADPAHRWLRACVREVCQASGAVPLPE